MLHPGHLWAKARPAPQAKLCPCGNQHRPQHSHPDSTISVLFNYEHKMICMIDTVFWLYKLVQRPHLGLDCYFRNEEELLGSPLMGILPGTFSEDDWRTWYQQMGHPGRPTLSAAHIVCGNYIPKALLLQPCSTGVNNFTLSNESSQSPCHMCLT